MSFEKFKLVDLTHPLDEKIPTWNGSCGFCLDIKKDYDRVFRVQQIKMHGGAGTHMDAPCHRFEGGKSIGEIPLEQLFAPACVIDVSDRAEADYEISVDDVERYEREWGPVEAGSLVLGYTGWSRYWSNPDRYRNVDQRGQMHFPAFSAKCGELLLARGVVGLGIDTLSPDCLDLEYPIHQMMLGAGKYILENVAHLNMMTPRGGYVIVLPIRALGAAEAPVRLVGLIE